jgi:NADH-quinone oxidoreductase subunit M
MSVPLLSLLVFLPLVAAGLLWLLPARAARYLVAVAMLLALGLATWVLVAYLPSGERFQLVERAAWISSLNVHYLVGVDGLSVLFLPATALLFLGSWSPAGTRCAMRRGFITACCCCSRRRR